MLERLGERELADRLPRRPGQKEERYTQLLGEDATPAPAPSFDAPVPDEAGDDRLAALEEAVTALRDEVAALRSELASLR